MSQKLDRARRYHSAIHQVLMNDWDPIGVEGVAEAKDEYDTYVSGVYSRLIRHAPRHELFGYLWSVETEHMQLRGDRQKTEKVVSQLLRIRDDIETTV